MVRTIFYISGFEPYVGLFDPYILTMLDCSILSLNPGSILSILLCLYERFSLGSNHSFYISFYISFYVGLFDPYILTMLDCSILSLNPGSILSILLCLYERFSLGSNHSFYISFYISFYVGLFDPYILTMLDCSILSLNPGSILSITF